MADGDRPIVLVPLATARKAARRAGVTLNLSAEDIALAGKWKHGWIPLDAVASAVKAKRYHGGGGGGRTVRGKGRAGSAVESRREQSRGRAKVKVGAPERASGPRDDYGKAHVYDPATGRAATAPASLADHARTHSDASLRDLTRRFSEGTAEGRAVRAEIARRQSAALLEGKSAGSMRARRDSMGVLVRPTGPVTSTSSGLPSGYRITNDEFGPALYSNGKLLRTTSKGNEHNLVQYAKDHAAGDTSAHPRTVQDQLDAAKAGKASLDGRSAASMSAAERARAAEIMHGTGSKQHRKALATARVQQTAQDRHRSVEAARGEPKLADLSESDLRGLISRYGEKSVQADAARAEMLRRAGPATLAGRSSAGAPVAGFKTLAAAQRAFDGASTYEEAAAAARAVAQFKKRPGDKIMWGGLAVRMGRKSGPIRKAK